MSNGVVVEDVLLGHALPPSLSSFHLTSYLI